MEPIICAVCSFPAAYQVLDRRSGEVEITTGFACAAHIGERLEIAPLEVGIPQEWFVSALDQAIQPIRETWLVDNPEPAEESEVPASTPVEEIAEESS